jgi:ATP-dependent DNA helicase RecQ
MGARWEEKRKGERSGVERTATALDPGTDRASAPLERARAVLYHVFGYPSFREGQERAIAAALSGRDALVVMPTGSGKSLCYQVPAIVLPGVTLVVSPLIALMKDQVDALRLRGVEVTLINSSISAEEQWARLAAVEAGAFKLVYVAPERFRSRAFRQALAGARVSLLAVDEAHCISEWGHDFRPDYRRLREVRALLPGVPAIALTATATPDVREDIARELALADPERVITGFDRPNLALEVEHVRSRAAKAEALLAFVREVEKEHGEDGLPAGIIYAGTRKRAEDVAAILSGGLLPGNNLVAASSPPRCLPYHAGLDAGARRSVQEDFMEGRLPWVAATNAFGMGVDKADIRFVVHYDLPGSIEAYYQEVGRAGRDGQPSRCRLLHADSDRRLQEFFIEGANPRPETIVAVHLFLSGLGENPIFRSLVDLERLFRETGAGRNENPLAFSSSVAILERAGLLERLDHHENLAEVACAAERWPENPHAERATLKHALHDALGRVFERSPDEPAAISLERWAAELGLPEESLRRGLHELDREGRIRFTPPFRGRAIRLPRQGPPAGEWPIDFEALERRRKRDEERLEEVVRFARGHGCRRAAVLRYFGEEHSSGLPCRCDRCREGSGSAPRPLAEDESLLVRKVLSGVARARGRCGKALVIRMLAGSKAKAMEEMGLLRLSTHGILRDHGRERIREIFDLCAGEGLIGRRGDTRPVVILTERGVRVMKGEETVELPLPPRAPGPPPSCPGSPPSCPGAGRRREAEGDQDHDPALFEKLRALRRRIAAELGVPAYRVFSDRTLRAMASEVPRTEADLLRIHGVGNVTLGLFGERFLEALRDHRPPLL